MKVPFPDAKDTILCNHGLLKKTLYKFLSILYFPAFHFNTERDRTILCNLEDISMYILSTYFM